MRATQAYLVLYNALQGCGWAAVVVQLVRGALDKGSADGATAAAMAGLRAAMPIVSFVQLVGLMEMMHVAVGLVRGSLPAAMLQAFGRNIVWFCFAVALFTPEAMGFAPPKRGNYLEEVDGVWPAVVLAFAWALAEICRYPFYVTEQFGATPSFLKYLRYTGFIVLYPLGATAEATVLMRGLTKVAMLQWFNCPIAIGGFEFFFVFQTFVHIVAPPGYLAGFPMIYLYMLRRRRSALREGPRYEKIKDAHTPAQLERVDKFIEDANGDVVAFIYGSRREGSVTAAKPFGESWCPDCTTAFPIIEPRLKSLPPTTIVLDLPVDRSPYKGLEPFSKVHPLKEHPSILLERVPTLLYLQRNGPGSRTRFDRYALVEEECHVEEDVAALLSAAWKKEQ